MTAHDTELATAIAQAVAAFDRTLILLGLPGFRAGFAPARAAGLRTAIEAFAGHAYEPDGSLMSGESQARWFTTRDTVVARAGAGSVKAASRRPTDPGCR